MIHNEGKHKFALQTCSMVIEEAIVTTKATFRDQHHLKTAISKNADIHRQYQKKTNSAIP